MDEVFQFQQILARFTEYRSSKAKFKNLNFKVQLDEDEVVDILNESKNIFMNQPMLIVIEAPVKVCGDTHGQFQDLMNLFNKAGWPPASKFLFLINHRIGTVIKYHDNFFLLRGNHEAASVNRIYGFYEECKQRYSIGLWQRFQDVFNCMPVAALIEEKIFCMHGGLSPELKNWDQIRRINRPCDVPDSGLLCDLLWADPQQGIDGYQQNTRGVSFNFGADVVLEFTQRMNIDLVCRAHQVVENGYELFADRHLVTVFSAPNYFEFDNAGGIMIVDRNMTCSFQVIRPAKRGQKQANL